MKFAAAVMRNVGAPLTIEEIEVGSLGPNDVLVRLHAAGLCHTDMEVMQGAVASPPCPCILGHEGAGVVEKIGKDVTRVRPGDHVVCAVFASCGTCFYCAKGQPMFCEEVLSSLRQGTIRGGAPRMSQGARPVHHFLGVSCFAEYTILPEAGAIVIPPEIGFDTACLIGCCVTTGVSAVTRVAKVPIGASVAVVGCGPIGLNVLQGARIVSAETIIAIDTNRQRLELARSFGATHTLNPAEGDVIEAVKSLTSGRGVDYAFEAAGNDASIQTSLEITRPGGDVLILGKTPLDHKVPIRFGSIMSEKKIMRSTLGGGFSREDFPALCRLYLGGKLKLDELISRRIGLHAINEGFADVKDSKLIRAVIEMHT